MAAYRRVDDSCHLQADCQEPGSAPEPYARLSSMGYLYLGGSGAKWLAMLDSGAEGPGFKSQSQRCWVTVLGKLFTPIVPLFTKQQNW